MFPSEFKKLEVQNASRYYDQSVRSAAGRQSCSKMALKPCTKTETGNYYYYYYYYYYYHRPCKRGTDLPVTDIGVR